MLIMLPIALSAAAQETHPHKLVDELPESVDEVRTQSGVDPTRVSSRIGYSAWFYDKEADRVQINNRLSVTINVNDWSFLLKADMVSLNTLSHTRFVTGFGDLKFGMVNAFYSRGKNALAASLDFVLPTASGSIAQGAGMGSYFHITPSLTYSYTVDPSLMFAVAPQYTFSVSKPASYPPISLLTLRMFIAKFTPKGYFFVLEPRPMYDFQASRFDFTLSPMAGRTLGGGYTLLLLSEIPLRGDALRKNGALFLIGFNRTF